MDENERGKSEVDLKRFVRVEKVRMEMEFDCRSQEENWQRVVCYEV